MINQFAHDHRDDIARYRKPNADVTTTRRDDRRVDPDHGAFEVHQCTTGITRINGGICLNKVFIPFNAETASPKGADDSQRNGLLKSKRITYRNHKIPHPQRTRIGEGKCRKSVALDLQDGEVDLGVDTDELRWKRPAISQRNVDFVCPINDVAVGDNVPTFRINDNAGTRTL